MPKLNGNSDKDATKAVMHLTSGRTKQRVMSKNRMMGKKDVRMNKRVKRG